MSDIIVPSPAKAVVLDGLCKSYGAFQAVQSLDLTIEQGEVFGLLGPNGAGKTTTILMLLGLTEPSGGEVSVLGLSPARNALEIKRRVGYMPDDIGFYEDRTALDNLVYTARLNGIGEAEARRSARELLERVGLLEAGSKKVGTFSRGMRQRLGLADVLIKRPQMIILDEPTLGIDPKGVLELLDLIRQLSKEEGITVLLSSHQLQQVQQICDRVGLFVRGKLIASGNVQQLAEALEKQSSIVIELEVGLWSNALQEKLSAIDGVLSLRAEPAGAGRTAVEAACDRDLTATLARVAAADAELLSLRRRSLSLDDIYHRYFEEGGG